VQLLESSWVLELRNMFADAFVDRCLRSMRTGHISPECAGSRSADPVRFSVTRALYPSMVPWKA
jgi:hypothetical protein